MRMALVLSFRIRQKFLNTYIMVLVRLKDVLLQFVDTFQLDSRYQNSFISEMKAKETPSVKGRLR
jgi:hypothetical protein